jgi:hypothetical protein
MCPMNYDEIEAQRKRNATANHRRAQQNKRRSNRARNQVARASRRKNR